MIALILAFLLSATSAYAHPGFVDSYGCHNNAKLNVYECHKGTQAGKSWANPGGKEKMLAEIAPPPPSVSITGEAVLTWNAPTDAITKGYWLYWGVESGKYHAPIHVPLVTKLDLSGLLKGATYYFALKAHSEDGTLSPFSNEASKTLMP